MPVETVEPSHELGLQLLLATVGAGDDHYMTFDGELQLTGMENRQGEELLPGGQHGLVLGEAPIGVLPGMARDGQEITQLRPSDNLQNRQ